MIDLYSEDTAFKKTTLFWFLWKLQKSVSPQGIVSLVIGKRFIHKEIARNHSKWYLTKCQISESHRLSILSQCNSGEKMVVTGCDRKGNGLRIRRTVSSDGSVFSWGWSYTKYLISFGIHLFCFIDLFIHSINIWTCSVPLYHGGKEHNLYRETYLTQGAALLLILRSWTYNWIPQSFSFLICYIMIIIPNLQSWCKLLWGHKVRFCI